MDTERTRKPGEAPEDGITLLGVASVETHGGPKAGEEMGGFEGWGLSTE